MRDEPVRQSLCVPNIPPLLFRQTEAALRRFFPGSSIAVDPVPHTNGVTLGIRTSDSTDFHRPQHVGFGLSHVLPILVAALVAKEGDLLIVENPEVHLHPAGQALMGRFLSEVAASGIQVLLETHSDHALSGVRRAVRDGVLQSEDLALHFFRGRDVAGAQVCSPRIDTRGNIDFWPEGFFDQFDKDMAALAGWDA
jgi:predicted ATPase